MTAAFRTTLTPLLPASEETVTAYLLGRTAKDWQPLAELFAARLPEFDAVIAFPSSTVLAEQVAQIRGVPLLLAQAEGESVTLSGEQVSGEAAFITLHLRSGENVIKAIAAAAGQGLTVPVIGAAVERTSLGGRSRLAQEGVIVRAAFQLADTPQGLNIERRNPDRWTASV